MNFFDADYVDIAEQVHGARSGSVVVETICATLGSEVGHSTVLDIGCGYGRIAIPLAHRVGSVLGVDRSAELIKEANARSTALSSINCQFLVADASSLALRGKYDSVLLLDSVLGGDEPADRQLMATARRSLRSGGLLFASSLHLPAVLRHLDRAGRASFQVSTGAGTFIDEVSYEADTGILATTRFHAESGRSDELKVRLWDASSWVRFMHAFGLADVMVTALDGSRPGIDTAEILVCARRR